MTNANPDLDKYFEKQKLWKEEMLALRRICLDSGLEEVKKWYQPCYAFNGKTLMIIGSFKDFCTLNFFNGVLLKDKQKILEFQGENSRSAKVVKFTSLEQVQELEPVLKAYIKEMLELEKAGAKVILDKKPPEDFPVELQEFFDQDKDLKTAFKQLTPGRQRSWLLHFNGAKQSETRVRRIEKAREKIFEGKGFNEK